MTESELIATRASAIQSLVVMHPDLPMPSFTLYGFDPSCEVKALLDTPSEVDEWAQRFGATPRTSRYPGKDIGSYEFTADFAGITFEFWAQVGIPADRCNTCGGLGRIDTDQTAARVADCHACNGTGYR